MTSADQASSSPWNVDVVVPGFPPLATNEGADVCIVGAGIAGLSTALLLVKEGRKVVVLDDGPIGGGETGRTTAHLSPVMRTRYSELEHLHGADDTRRIAVSHMEAIELIESLVDSESMQCEFLRRDGYLIDAAGTAPDLLERELLAVRAAGIPGVELLDRAPLRDAESGRCLRFPRQAQVHPLKYLAYLAAGIAARGGKIYTGSRAVTFAGGSPAMVHTAQGHAVRCDAVVVATNTPVNDVFAIHTKQAAYRTYAIACAVPQDALAPALYWDTADPYHYMRFLEVRASSPGSDDVLLIGGEDHKTGQADDADERYVRLQEWGRTLVPGLGPVLRRWSGQVIEPVDGIALIGRNPGDHDNVFVVTGDAGNGMTHGTIAGMLLTDLIMGRTNPWTSLYDPARKPVRAAKRYMRENLNVAGRYAEWFAPTELPDGERIPPGTGVVVRDGLRLVAVYRDDDGVVHRRSAACPHLGCVVHWNTTERTWDCPCHGSRFDATGHVINGPACAHLAPAPPPESKLRALER